MATEDTNGTQGEEEKKPTNGKANGKKNGNGKPKTPLIGATLYNIPIQKKLTTPQYHFLQVHKSMRMSLVDTWKYLHPTSKATYRTKLEAASKMWTRIKNRLTDDEYISVLDLGPRRVFEVIEEGLNATRETEVNGEMVEKPDLRIRNLYVKDLIDIGNMKQSTLNVKGDVRHLMDPSFLDLINEISVIKKNGNGSGNS